MSSQQCWLPQVESDLAFYVDFLQNSKLRFWSLIFSVPADGELIAAGSFKGKAVAACCAFRHTGTLWGENGM